MFVKHVALVHSAAYLFSKCVYFYEVSNRNLDSTNLYLSSSLNEICIFFTYTHTRGIIKWLKCLLHVGTTMFDRLG